MQVKLLGIGCGDLPKDTSYTDFPGRYIIDTEQKTQKKLTIEYHLEPGHGPVSTGAWWGSGLSKAVKMHKFDIYTYVIIF